MSIEEGQRYLKLGNGELIFVKAIGPVVLFFENNRTLCLEDCLFVPDFKRNLVYVSCLVEHDLTLQFNSSVSIRSKSFFICSDDLMNNIYFLSPLSYDINAIKIVENEHNHLAKKRKVSNETYLWHLLFQFLKILFFRKFWLIFVDLILFDFIFFLKKYFTMNSVHLVTQEKYRVEKLG